MLLKAGAEIPFQPTTLPSERNAKFPALPAAANATTLLALAGIFVPVPPPQAAIVPSVRTAKLTPTLPPMVKFPATETTLLKFGGGRHSLFRFLPHAATGPGVSCASALVATPTSL